MVGNSQTRCSGVTFHSASITLLVEAKKDSGLPDGNGNPSKNRAVAQPSNEICKIDRS
jgi:hypothetical protein